MARLFGIRCGSADRKNMLSAGYKTHGFAAHPASRYSINPRREQGGWGDRKNRKFLKISLKQLKLIKYDLK